MLAVAAAGGMLYVGVTLLGDRPDDSAACEAFSDLNDDVRDDVVVEDEMRPRVQEIEQEAEDASRPVREASRGLLRAVTIRDRSGLETSFRQMERACG